MNYFLTKKDLVELIYNQFPIDQSIKSKLVMKMSRQSTYRILLDVQKAGFVVENFGYNRFVIK